jgi:hypothetical protein
VNKAANPTGSSGEADASPGWGRLRARLTTVSNTVTITWDELERLVGGLPDSAYRHAAYWSGERGKWPGFRARAHIGDSVTFTRRDSTGSRPTARTSAKPVGSSVSTRQPAASSRDIWLVGCVKSKLDHPAPAKDLYRSTLFQLERSYAEASGFPWFILSAKYGLLEPEQVIPPYELALGSTPPGYRQNWGQQVVADLAAKFGPLTGKTIEIHASSKYVNAIRDPLQQSGATVTEPLAGLQLGQRLHWYKTGPLRWVTALRDRSSAQTPGQFLMNHRSELDSPGLYSWWVDEPGSTDLTRGLSQPVSPGLIYAGLAGATRTKSKRPSNDTLWLRIKTMHLGRNHHFSTLRWSIGAILAESSGTANIDEATLTAWMHAHLSVIAVPVADAETLADLESDVLTRLDPPLNLAKVPPTALRRRLRELRRAHGGRVESLLDAGHPRRR